MVQKEKEREREKERDRQTERERERERDRQRERERESERERDGMDNNQMRFILLVTYRRIVKFISLTMKMMCLIFKN